MIRTESPSWCPSLSLSTLACRTVPQSNRKTRASSCYEDWLQPANSYEISTSAKLSERVCVRVRVCVLSLIHI